MSFRTVVIKNRCKLDYSLNYLVYRGEETRKIHLSEISVLIIESTCVSITTSLINELIKNNVNVIFCDEKHLPNSQLLGLHNNYHSAKNVSLQVAWSEVTKKEIWTDIIFNKISNQIKLLEKHNKDAHLLKEYLSQLKPGDSTNREGHAAKVYFNALFDELSRRTPSFYNSALNYGYAIVLSAFCREIVASGYVTQLGIWHCNEFNHYNLASDMMETFRIIVDDLVLTLTKDDRFFKEKMSNILNTKVTIGKKQVFLDNAIHIYSSNLFNKLNNNGEKILNYTSYELPLYENADNV